ncbi:hypothetical protein [Phormidium sp. CCY1219]|uniref:hypothetical protein n=1 Tax=Phormidium sp. CCY1219 TaxID=2886104 RepID=UPI002D1E6E55|nr:hypothetical protein [Phormidium sp. CCY1219]MEB3827036.1 hypothetical protein [Phormidium sp. CCY1219]
MTQPAQPTDYHHWQYFLALENDLINVSRYIEFSKVTEVDSKNAKVYSIELVRIFFAACAECENIGKSLAHIRKGDLYDISDEIFSLGNTNYAIIPFQQISCPAHSLTFTPWQKWSLDKINHPITLPRLVYQHPAWWTHHNNVKHNRVTAYEEANLLNTLNAVAGLMCLLFHDIFNDMGRSIPLEELTRKGYARGYTISLPPSLAPKLFIPQESGIGFGGQNWTWDEYS